MNQFVLIGAAAIVLLLLLAVAAYIVSRYYEARHDRTYMTQDERGFKRALRGKVVLWDFEESIVKGASAPRVEYVAVDPSTGGRRNVRLLDPRTGAINLRPQYCAPLPFEAATAEGQKVTVDARVQFSLNRDLLKHVYEIDEFAQALETRIQSAFRSEIGKRRDEELRASLHEVERAVVERLRQDEREGDEAGELGMALGANFHTVNFSYVQHDAFAEAGGAPAGVGAAPASDGSRPRLGVGARGVLTLHPDQLDRFGDVFKGRDAASTAGLLAILEMQTRQNIAEALAASGQLVVVTPQELGLMSAAAQREAGARATAARPAAGATNLEAGGAHGANGGMRPTI